MKEFRRSAVLLFITFLLVFLPASRPILASGPGEGGRRVRLDDEPVGPYLLRVVTSPTPPQVENLNVEVRVTDAATGQVLTGAEVKIRAEHTEIAAGILEEVASHDIAPIPTEYAAHLLIPKPGLWKITIKIVSELGSAETSFLERVRNPPAIGVLIAVGAPVAGLLALVGFFFWLQRNTSRERENGHEA
ncbi:MAG: hypothetical protein GTO14_18105 [Anaerolineales bacterium]|nr:hypothetical protein [Anaerolineales bacterium]